MNPYEFAEIAQPNLTPLIIQRQQHHFIGRGPCHHHAVGVRRRRCRRIAVIGILSEGARLILLLP